MKWKPGSLYGLSALVLGAVIIVALRVAGSGRDQAPSRPVAPHPRIAVPQTSALTLPKFPRGKGKIAIVLDDWGYSLRRVPSLSSLRRPVTVAVLPNLPYSRQVAKAAESSGHEVILHMPMQAMDPKAPGEAGTLFTGMSQKEVEDLLDRALSTVPGAQGVSNHQGSKATADPVLMGAILRRLKQKKLYFLDSFVTKHSVCTEVAHRFGLPFAQRSVFLDNEETLAAIQERLTELARVANARGEAIGIGHDRPAMVEALLKAVPALEEAGYRLVPVSELADARSRD